MSRFVKQAEIQVDPFPWGDVGWRCAAKNTGCTSFVVIDVSLAPGTGHEFHRHPHQDELIVIKAGSVVQYIEGESTTLHVGDSVYIDRDVVHASYNDGTEMALLEVILAPSVGDESYELVDVSAESPWNTLRS